MIFKDSLPKFGSYVVSALAQLKVNDLSHFCIDIYYIWEICIRLIPNKENICWYPITTLIHIHVFSFNDSSHSVYPQPLQTSPPSPPPPSSPHHSPPSDSHLFVLSQIVLFLLQSEHPLDSSMHSRPFTILNLISVKVCLLLGRQYSEPVRRWRGLYRALCSGWAFARVSWGTCRRNSFRGGCAGRRAGMVGRGGGLWQGGRIWWSFSINLW